MQDASFLAHYARILRSNISLVAVFVVGVPLVAVLVSLTQSDRFAASSTVLVSRQSIANQLSGGSDVGVQQQSFQQILVTQARLARTPTVLRNTLKAARLPSSDAAVDRFRNDSSVEAENDSDLLNFEVTRGEPAEARRLAIAYANAYIGYRRNLDGAALEKALEDVNAALVEARRSNGASSRRVERLSASKQELEERLVLQTANAQVVAVPDRAEQVQPKPARNGVIGLILGVMLGVGAALLRNTLDTRVRSGTESETALETPILSRVPRFRPRGSRAGETPLVMLTAPESPEAESYRILRASLNFGVVTHQAVNVMVTSAVQSEGKSTTLSNLAVATAMAGKRVALVDLDLRRPTLARLFGVESGVGLTTVAVGDARLDDALVEIELPSGDARLNQAARSGSLHVLPSGSLPPDPAEFVGTDAVGALLRELREQFDVVYIDAPPVLAVSDATVIASHADAAFVCVRLGVVRRTMLRDTRRALDRLEISVLGQVLTDAEADSDGHYGAYYGYVVSSEHQRNPGVASGR